MKPQIPWLRVFIEGVVIVGSILLAFGIDAWWEGRQERELETEYLAALLDEIDSNIESISGFNRQIWERSDSDLRRAQRLLLEGLHVDSAGGFILAINRGMVFRPNTLSTAIFDELTSSGRIVLIEDLGVRREILGLYARLESEVRGRDGRPESELTPILSRHIPPGMFERLGPRLSLREDVMEADALRSLAGGLGSEESLAAAINGQLRLREIERSSLDFTRELLEEGRQALTDAMEAAGVE